MILLGVDAGTWDVLGPYMAKGLLPNLTKLRDRGVSAPLRSMKASSSPVVWTSIATGKTPEKHGITFFVRFPDGNTGRPGPVTSTMRRGKAFWNILSSRGFDVAVVGWFVTWPVEAVNGRMISDRAHWGRLEEERTFPPAYLSDLATPSTDEAISAMPRFMDFPFDLHTVDAARNDEQQRTTFLVFDRFVRAWIRDTYYLRAADRILSDGPLPKVLALYLRGTDDVQHGFWKFMDPRLFPDVTPNQAERFGKVIEKYWQFVDTAIGNVLSHYDSTPRLVIVVSDHGAGPAVGEFAIDVPEYMHLSGSHREHGIFLMEGPGVREGTSLQEVSIYDIAPTLLYYLDQPIGRDMDGVVLREAFTQALSARPVKAVDTHDDASDAPTGHVESPYDDQALEHLRSLGYIE